MAQRVFEASVLVDGAVVGAIEGGLLVYLGAAADDTDDDVEAMANKLAGLRIFRNEEGKMSRSVQDVAGAVLVVPQFTLFGDVRKGRRPSFMGAAAPEEALRRFEQVVSALRAKQLPTETGQFRAMMDVRSRVDGPITILIDTRKTF